MMRLASCTAAALVGIFGATFANAARADDAACVAASETSLTLRQQEKLHDALKQLAICAAPTCPQEVKAECAKRIDELNAAMPTLILSAKDGDGNDLSHVTVTMDGAPLLTTLDGRSISIDPGEHAFRFTLTGQPPITVDHQRDSAGTVDKTLVLREGDKERRESVTMGAPTMTTTISSHATFWGAQRVLGLITGGVGVIGLGLGAYFGGFAISAQNQEHSDCVAAGCEHYAQAVADYNTAGQDAVASTIAFIAGAALLATGVVLWFTSPRLKIAPTTTGKSMGLVIGGEF